MNLEGLDCWDDYPMEHGCICGNDCEPPARMRATWSAGSPIDGTELRMAYEPTVPMEWAIFDPRPGYSQNKEDYA